MAEPEEKQTLGGGGRKTPTPLAARRRRWPARGELIKARQSILAWRKCRSELPQKRQNEKDINFQYCHVYQWFVTFFAF